MHLCTRQCTLFSIDFFYFFNFKVLHTQVVLLSWQNIHDVVIMPYLILTNNQRLKLKLHLLHMIRDKTQKFYVYSLASIPIF